MSYTFTAKISPQCYPETRATQSILILVNMFFPFNSLSSLFTFSMTYFDEHGWWLVNTSALIAARFPTLSPFVLISTDSHVSGLCFACFTKPFL